MAISSIILTHKVCFFVCILNYRTLDVIHNNWIASVAPVDVNKGLNEVKMYVLTMDMNSLKTGFL